MNFSEITLIKRDGKQETFSIEKIKNAITKAFRASNQPDTEREIYNIALSAASHITTSNISVEEVQDLVEQELMRHNPTVAKKYIIYREWRNIERHKKTNLKHVMDGIVCIEKNDVNLNNANISSNTPAGQMMTFASEITKDYAEKYLINTVHAQAHKDGDIHIHDLDYYPTKTTTCLQYDLDDIFERGFKTKNGSVRTPQSIFSYATLATIIFQTAQNEQHGGQSIPAFDFFMAKGVLKSFKKQLISNILFALKIVNAIAKPSYCETIKKIVQDIVTSIQISQTEQDLLLNALNELHGQQLFDKQTISIFIQEALEKTRKDTYQAMEAFIHNLNTMHSRGGNQVVFSSINYGTDTSPEGRMVIRELLAATVSGLGNGEVPVFPIQIFKVKDGVSHTINDFEKTIANFNDAISGKLTFEAPNFDLLLEAARTTAVALFPNFLFMDTEFNQNEKWNPNDPKRYLYEVTSMGCRTRVFENVNGEKSSIGRGNISFTSLNLPRLAIKAKMEAETLHPSGDKTTIQQAAREIFLKLVASTTEMMADQLYNRYQYQRTALARQFPFIMSNNIWKGGDTIQTNDCVGDVISSGTLALGFIGGHNAMVAIYGEGHGINQNAYQTLYDAIVEMNKVAEKYKAQYKLNYSVLATPAEGLAGRFTRLDRKKFGVINGVNDNAYYVNSFHIDVKEHISIAQKIELEAPFHAITRGGHITYVELDGEAKKNVVVILKIIQQMQKSGIGYGSINHPIDTCQKCGHKGVIYSTCPVCQSKDIIRMRRITGYLTGDLTTWNSAKIAEEQDRVKHV
ncbi:MAG: anaerobic ribonucleoside triphosphate reductase [Deltaproteobacteria bacterium]|jgi:ribonucleoside-triphosphate reductase|nr:anaerobic ribonucleoside triphosphate reductase [Deltaproteobacteria bacterium]